MSEHLHLKIILKTHNKLKDDFDKPTNILVFKTINSIIEVLAL